MGEMADFVLDNDEFEPLYDHGGLLSCRYCGESDLHWELDERTDKHRLTNAEYLVHVCDQYREARHG